MEAEPAAVLLGALHERPAPRDEPVRPLGVPRDAEPAAPVVPQLGVAVDVAPHGSRTARTVAPEQLSGAVRRGPASVEPALPRVQVQVRVVEPGSRVGLDVTPADPGTGLNLVGGAQIAVTPMIRTIRMRVIIITSSKRFFVDGMRSKEIVFLSGILYKRKVKRIKTNNQRELIAKTCMQCSKPNNSVLVMRIKPSKTAPKIEDSLRPNKVFL